MGITQQIMDRAASLPPEKQQELLDFAEFLRQQSRGTTQGWKSLRGALAHRGIDITEDDLAEARHEMWGNFPGEEK